MVHVASEMQRLNVKKPLLIGGATTSKAHTAVKIDPCFDQDTIAYVPDASKAVGIATRLMSTELKPELADELREEYEKIRIRNAGRAPKSNTLDYANAVLNRHQLDWGSYKPPKPTFLGTKAITDFPIEELIDYIDWTPFFIAWELAGKYPNILEDEVVGESATQLFADATAMLNDIMINKRLTANAVIGFWPANADGDDIVLFDDDEPPWPPYEASPSASANGQTQ